MHLLRVYFHDLVHDCVLVFLCKNNNFVFLRQPPQHFLQSRPESCFDTLSEYVLALYDGTSQIQNEGFRV